MSKKSRPPQSANAVHSDSNLDSRSDRGVNVVAVAGPHQTYFVRDDVAIKNGRKGHHQKGGDSKVRSKRHRNHNRPAITYSLSLSLFLFVFRLEMYSPFLMLRFLNSFAFFGETIRVSDYILSVFVWKLFLVLVSLVVQVVLKREIMAYIFENL